MLHIFFKKIYIFTFAWQTNFHVLDQSSLFRAFQRYVIAQFLGFLRELFMYLLKLPVLTVHRVLQLTYITTRHNIWLLNIIPRLNQTSIPYIFRTFSFARHGVEFDGSHISRFSAVCQLRDIKV